MGLLREHHGAQMNYRAAPRPIFLVAERAGKVELVKLAQAVRPAARKRSFTETMGLELREFYAGVLTEPLPDAWAASLDKLESDVRRKSKSALFASQPPKRCSGRLLRAEETVHDRMILDPRTGSRVAITVPDKRDAKKRARLRIIRELDRWQPAHPWVGSSSSRPTPR